MVYHRQGWENASLAEEIMRGITHIYGKGYSTDCNNAPDIST